MMTILFFAIAMSMMILTQEQTQAVEIPVVLTEIKTDQTQIDIDSLEILAKCVEAEAGNQDQLGKRLVVDVILNRVDSERFPNDIISVISQENQFSVWGNGMLKKAKPTEDTFEAIQLELESRTDSEIMFFTAKHYNKYCIPAYVHGDHYFGY